MENLRNIQDNNTIMSPVWNYHEGDISISDLRLSQAISSESTPTSNNLATVPDRSEFGKAENHWIALINEVPNHQYKT